MSRLIDADVLIEILTIAIRNMKGMAKFIGAEDDPEIQMEIKAYTDIANGVKDMPTIEPEPHWIPCSERLPKDDVQVLCTDSEGFVYIAWHCDYDIIEKTKCWCDVHYRSLSEDDIIAWMPLPEPYREEQE